MQYFNWLSGGLLLLLTLPAPRAQDSSYATQWVALDVRDRRGQFVEDVRPDQVVVEDLPASVESMELDNAPRLILLLLDASGTMGDRKTASWSNAKQFVVQFAHQRKGEDSIGLEAFAEKHELLSPFTQDFQSLVNRIETYAGSGKGRKMLGVTLDEILSRQENRLRFGDVIVLVSSGERSDADKSDFRRIRNGLIREGIRICLVRIPSVLEKGMLKEVTDVSDFVRATGGIELNMTSPTQNIQFGNGVRLSPDQIEFTAKNAYAFSRAYYRLGLKVLKPSTESRKLRLEIVGQQKEKLKGLQLSYPQYFVTSPAA